MKRLFQTKKTLNFKNWVEQHNPELKWDWSNPENLSAQLIDHIQVCGDLDLATVFQVFFDNYDPGLTVEQNEKFLNTDY